MKGNSLILLILFKVLDFSRLVHSLNKGEMKSFVELLWLGMCDHSVEKGETFSSHHDLCELGGLLMLGGHL